MPEAVGIAPALIAALDLFGIAVFAASGALAAARLKQTLVTFSFFALVTGVGGGTVRDLLIGAPVFWVQDWRFPATCLATALLVWITPARIWSPRALDWFDAVGLAVYSVFGAWKALSLGIGPLPAMMMGVITACVGGVIRDMLAGVPSIILRPEIYVTASALAAGSFVALNWLGMPLLAASSIAALSGFTLRAMAIARGWSIPAYTRTEAG
jgi:uncharacterized membrane protein YeiH